MAAPTRDKLSRASVWRGILLAAGKGRRFDATGHENKLLQIISDGQSVADLSARNLLTVLPDTLAVVSATNPPEASSPRSPLFTQLQNVGCTVSRCANAEQGMAMSIVHAIQQSDAYAGWIIALADMPYVKPDSILQLLKALEEGAEIAVLVYEGKRGNPVGFSKKYEGELLALTGDQGARRLLQRYPVTEITVNDPGILYDIDVPADIGKFA